MADKPDTDAFIKAGRAMRLHMLRSVDWPDVIALLEEVADQAAADRKGITEHQFLRSAHAQIRRLKDQVNRHPDVVADLRRQILSLTTARDGIQKLYDDLLRQTGEIEDGTQPGPERK